MTEPANRDEGGKVVMLGRCPHCGARAIRDFRPFCSKRCADLDLGRWLSGAYAIPAVETDDPDDEDQLPDHGDKF
mgnify:CR=1 FL=1